MSPWLLVFICMYWSKHNSKKRGNSHYLVCARIYLHAINPELTFAGLHSLRPPVVYVSVGSTSAVLVPSTAGSATTDSARFPKRCTLRTRCRANCTVSIYNDIMDTIIQYCRLLLQYYVNVHTVLILVRFGLGSGLGHIH